MKCRSIVLFSGATLLPICPGEVSTLICNETSTGSMFWEWRSSNGMMSRAYFLAENLNIPMTLVQNHNEEVNTTLLSVINSFVSSTLQFALSGNVTSANVTCNQELRRIKVIGQFTATFLWCVAYPT